MSKASFTIHSSPASLPSVETVHFAGYIHPRLKLTAPVTVKLVRCNGGVEAHAEALGISARGKSCGEALQSLGRELAGRYYNDRSATLQKHILEQQPALKRNAVV